MKCPLLIAAAITHDEKVEDTAVECGQGECAWWDEPVGRCLWLNVSEKLSLIYLELNDIAKELTLIRPPATASYKEKYRAGLEDD